MRSGRRHRVGLDLHFPLGIQQPGDHDHGRGRADVGEDLSVDPSHRWCVRGGNQKDTGPDHIGQGAAHIGQSGLDYGETTPGLLGHVRAAGPIGPDRRGTRNEHTVPVPHSPAETDARFEGRAGVSEATSGHSGIVGS